MDDTMFTRTVVQCCQDENILKNFVFVFGSKMTVFGSKMAIGRKGWQKLRQNRWYNVY